MRSLEQKERKNYYLEGSIAKTLIYTSLAMIPGTLALSLFSITDTYFVSRLGLDALAAMGFSFPITLLVNCIYHGLSTGMMTTFSHAVGEKDETGASRILALGLLLTTLVAISTGIIGAFVIRDLAALFVETPEVLDLVTEFLQIWFLGNITISLGLTSNKLLLAMGMPKQASLWMVVGMAANVLLAPALIFGFGPIPSLGIKGAALATVIAQGITPIGGLWLIHRRRPFLGRQYYDLKHLPSCWSKLLAFAIPATLSILIMPIGSFIMTWIAASFGDEAVASLASMARLESLAFIIPMSVGVTLTPMIAQNYAAKQFHRIAEIMRFSLLYVSLYLVLFTAVFFFFSEPLARIFSDNPTVIAITVMGLQIVTWGFPAQEIHRYCSFVYNGCNRPAKSALLNLFRILVLTIPLASLALVFSDISLMFYGRLAAEFISAVVALFFASRLVKSLIAGNASVALDEE